MAVGFAYDAGAGTKQLSAVFAGCYVVGCIAAVLAVRQAGIFTAVIQPPLLLFVAVPSGYFLLTNSDMSNLKDTLINCAYPLVERFPLMFFTSAVVLLIGVARWFFGSSGRQGSSRTTEASSGLGTAVTAKLSSLFSRSDDNGIDEPPRRKRATDRPARPVRNATTSGRRSAKAGDRATPSRSRHARPPETEVIPPVAERPRRPRTARQGEPPAEPPRRKSRPSTGQRKAPPPADRRAGYERRRRIEDEPLPPPRRSSNGTHHPISQVRYRGVEEGDDRAAEYRPRRRTPRERQVESWEYDI
jgi:hypothetical protein